MPIKNKELKNILSVKSKENFYFLKFLSFEILLKLLRERVLLNPLYNFPFFFPSFGLLTNGNGACIT